MMRSVRCSRSVPLGYSQCDVLRPESYCRALPLPRPTYPVRTQVDSYCKETSQRIVGYYQANELADDTELGPFGKKIAALIRSKCPEAVCLLYQGASGPPTPDDLRFWSLGPDGKRTGPTPTLPDAPKTLPVLEGYLDSSVHHKLVDFDVHLDDASRDWLNTALLA